MAGKKHWLFRRYQNFSEKTDEDILEKILHQDTTKELRISQRESWKAEIKIMKNTMMSLKNKMGFIEDNIIDNGRIIFEYSIPRLKGRIDAVVIIGHILLLNLK